MDELGPFLEIDRCLLIHDNRHEDEGAADVELVLYFWPDHVPLGHQIALLGACSWVKAFSQSFTGSPVRVFEMKRFKLAMRSIGPINLVLTAGHNYSRKSLETQLDHVVQAFLFYHLSPENIELRARERLGPIVAAQETERGTISPLRAAIIQEYQSAGSLLVPMVDSFHFGLIKNFHPLEYSKLLTSNPSTGNVSTSRFFAKASSMIWKACRVDDFISGCVLDHESKIICTHLDIDTTRWICNFMLADRINSRKYGVPLTEKLTVYISSSCIQEHLHQKREFFRAKNDLGDSSTFTIVNPEHSQENDDLEDITASLKRTSFYGTVPSSNNNNNNSNQPSSSNSDNTINNNKNNNNDPNNYSDSTPIPVRLHLINTPRFSLIMLASDNSQHFLTSHQLLDSVSAELASLELAISRVDIVDLNASDSQIESPSPNSHLSGTSPMRGSSLHSSPSVSTTSSPNALSNQLGVLTVSSRSLSRGFPTSPRPSENQSHTALRASSKSPASAYNYLSFSELAHTQEGNIGLRRCENSFWESLSFVHDTFNETPQITKVVFRDQQQSLFCRKLFGKETYFQQVNQPGSKFAELEEKARTTLATEHSIYLI